VSAGNISLTHKAQKQGVEIFPHPDAGKTRDKVAAAVGFGSGRTLPLSIAFQYSKT